MLRYLLLFFGILAISSGTASATQLSLISGFYKKSEPEEGYGTSEFSIGARLGLGPAQGKQWFGEARFGSISYSGNGAPDGSTILSVGGGQYIFMRGFGSGVRSYLSWLAAFRNEQTSPNETTEIESSGLFYAGAAGFRFDFSPSFFLDIQATLFESALMATDTTKVTVGGATEETETKRTEIYVDSFGGVDDVSFGVGLEF